MRLAAIASTIALMAKMVFAASSTSRSWRTACSEISTSSVCETLDASWVCASARRRCRPGPAWPRSPSVRRDRIAAIEWSTARSV
jgi:hypothetical protein